MRRTIAALAAAVATVAVTAPAAHADTVGVDGDGTLVVSAGPEQNRVGLQPSPLEDGRLVIYDGLSGQVTSATPSCEQWGADAVMCSWSPSAGVRVDLGDGNDDGYVSFGIPADAAIAFAGGPGNDTLAGDVQPTTFDGGPGDDLLNGGDGPDRLDGGEGDDEISGDGAADHIDGGGGNDLLSGDGTKDPAGDVIDGGAGTDRIESDWSDPTYFAEQKPVSITLAGGADDGRAGESDDIHGVEKIVAHQQARLVGSDAAEHLEVFQVLAGATLIGNGGADTLRGADGPDTIDGGHGPDTIDAGFGDDAIVGGPGVDTISGDRAGGDCGPLWCKYPYGNDTIDARDGERDSVTCGAGQDDVKADAADVVAADCETVTRDRSGPGPDPGSRDKRALVASIGRVKLAAALAHGLRLRVTAPAAGRVRATAKTARRTIATGSRRVTRAGRTTVVLRFTRKARRQLRRARQVKLGIAIRFAPKRGAVATKNLALTLKR